MLQLRFEPEIGFLQCFDLLAGNLRLSLALCECLPELCQLQCNPLQADWVRGAFPSDLAYDT
jgi:hypothetical protein